ncbi:MAG: ribbon-helix-helix domain-containing protein [Proteobacteria bacterium]|jgi:predicted DNA-binding protein|nr:ribbon-helix-helix domain-containing protein [Pseudomonadota bacterium]
MAQIALSTKLSVETYQALDAHCKATGAVKAQVVEEAIKMYLAKGGKK